MVCENHSIFWTGYNSLPRFQYSENGRVYQLAKSNVLLNISYQWLTEQLFRYKINLSLVLDFLLKQPLALSNRFTEVDYEIAFSSLQIFKLLENLLRIFK